MNKQFKRIDKRFEQVDKRFEQVDKRFEQVDKQFEQVFTVMHEYAMSVDVRFDKVHEELNRMKNDMVTKEYLDNKLADLRGDMVVLTRKENEKFNALVEILTMRKAITAEDADKVLKMQPFART